MSKTELPTRLQQFQKDSLKTLKRKSLVDIDGNINIDHVLKVLTPNPIGPLSTSEAIIWSAAIADVRKKIEALV